MKTTPFGILLLATLTGCAAPVPRQEPPVDRRAEETDPSDSYFPAGVFDEDHPAVDQEPAILGRAVITLQKLAGWRLDPDGR